MEESKQKMNIQTIQRIKSLSQNKTREHQLKYKYVLKEANISNKIMESKMRKREEMYMKHQQRQSRLENARINSELLRMEKIFKIERKQLNRDFNNIYRHIYQIFNIYDIIKDYNDYNYYVNERDNFSSQNKKMLLNDIKNEYSHKNY